MHSGSVAKAFPVTVKAKKYWEEEKEREERRIRERRGREKERSKRERRKREMRTVVKTSRTKCLFH